MLEFYSTILVGTFLESIALITGLYWIHTIHERKHK